MLTVIDNYAYLAALTNDVMDNPKLLNGMHVDTLSQLKSYAIEMDDFRVLALLTEIHTGIPMNDDHLPDWWLSDFFDDITVVKFEHLKGTNEIHWCDVRLDDGEPLTSDKHKPLLNAFKYWLIASDHPLENGGKLISANYASRKFNRILTLINTILLNSKALRLSECHLENVTDAFWLKVLLVIAESGESVSDDLYQTYSRVEELLNSVDVSKEELEAFKVRYPFAGREIASDEIVLDLKDRVKACCWLHKQRYYTNSTRDALAQSKPQGNNSVLIRLIFEGKILPNGFRIPLFPELALKPIPVKTEYQAVPNNERGEGASAKKLGLWLSEIKLINTNIDKNNIGTFTPVTSDVSVEAIRGLVSLRKQGRTKTLPPEFVFDLFRSSYELLKQFCSSPDDNKVNFWDDTLKLLTEASTKSSKQYTNPHRPHEGLKAFDESRHRDLPQTELGHWLKFEAIDLIHMDLKARGVLQLNDLPLTTDNRHDRIRNNESMLELFTVLQGAVQLLLGSIMARRQDELLRLKPYGNLVYINDDGKCSTTANPYTERDERWFLRFKVKKTGVEGKNLTADRPIPLSIAQFVWQVEQFNKQAIERGLVKEKGLSLFNYIDGRTFKLTKGGQYSFNAAFDALCDYFETAIVEMGSGNYHRHYVRQHQLRRFFALVFFWSKHYENMEALRWMLAHSDLEHLHNYITDNDDGRIVNSAKASVITQSVISNKSMIDDLEELEKLREIIAKRLTGNSSDALSIATLDDAIFDYEDESEYKTVPHISQLKAEQEIEAEVLTLLENGAITLYPEFFIVQDENGENVQSFNLILKVNELESE
ncbi:integrase [Vibrio sinaloensis]|uniref:integrase n=1 Tax=Photobacterium sp. (strain ATCC 43367) TaxID=379097 RepID=UPI0022B062E3|nr:integrase [Vibrio sinaloensis]MCZ4293190.1 integrase [Vibrio sinaloensis]